MPGRFEQAQGRAWLWPIALPAALTAASWLILFIQVVLLKQDTSPELQIAAIISGIASAVLTVGLAARRLSLERAARADSIAAMESTLDDIIEPLTSRLGEIAAVTSEEERSRTLQSFLQVTIDVASANIGPDQSRACLYLLDNGVHPNRSLILSNWPGRSNGQQPPSRISETTALGRFTLDTIDQRTDCLIKNIDEERIRGWTKTATGYATVIYAVVFAGDFPFGTLIFESPETGDLTRQDLNRVRLLARLLAAALAIGRLYKISITESEAEDS